MAQKPAPNPSTIQSSNDTVKKPQEGGRPKTGFDEAGAKPGRDAGLRLGEAGPGIGCTRRGIS